MCLRACTCVLSVLCCVAERRLSTEGATVPKGTAGAPLPTQSIGCRPTGVGYEPAPSCTSKPFVLRFTDAIPLGNSGVNREAVLESDGVYM